MSTRQLAIAYCRVSTGRQVEEGLSLDSQERTMRDAAEARGLTVEIAREAGRSAKNLDGRPVLRDVLDRLDRGEASALICARLDRLARSTLDLADIVRRSNRHGWRLVLLDFDLDTATPQGKLVVQILGSVAEFERELIGERQKDVHAERRARGEVWGVTAGPRTRLPIDVQRRIVAQHAAGATFTAIAAALNADSVPTAQGGSCWFPASVSRVVKAAQRAQTADEAAA